MAIMLSLGQLWAEGATSKVPFADPYILLDGDTYYAYGTHSANGIECYTSTDLYEWTYEGLALNKANTTESQWFWAPEVYKIDDAYYMYYSANEHLFVAKADSPKGPFVQVGGYQMESLLGSEQCIDSSVFFDDDGKTYIFFVRFNDGNCIWSAELSDDHITPVAGTLKKCINVSQSWEEAQGRINEGPNVIKHEGTYYLTYSANDYQSQNYGVGYATSKSPQGTWSKFGSNPILQKAFGLVGTGHHSLFTDKEGQLRMVFHAHNSSTAIHPRTMYICSMKWISTRLVVDNNKPLIRPALPGYPSMPDEVMTNWGYQRGGAVAVDLNNDGWLDIVAGGSGRTDRNESSNTFTRRRQMDVQMFLPKSKKWTTLANSSSVIKVANMPSIVPCDINADGNMDIVAFEAVGTSTTEEAYTGNYGSEGIFIGLGNGKFNKADVTVSNLQDFDIKAPAKADVLDIDNDGLLDIVCAGYQDDTSYNVILHNLGFEGNTFTFEAIPYEPNLKFTNIILEAYDMNNDGLTDFLISAYVEGNSDMTRFTDIYLNSTKQPGQFQKLGLGTTESGVIPKGYGALQVADMNNDGHLDFILAGMGDNKSGEAAVRQRLYLNNGEAIPTFTATDDDFITDQFKPTTAVDNAFGVYDWLGDGNFHVIAAGINGGSSTSSGQLYTNDGTGRLTKSVTMPGALSPSTIFVDYNADGVKDFIQQGVFSDKNYLGETQTGKTAVVYYNRNKTAETPEPPVNLKAEADGNGFILSWEAPTTAKGNVTFEFYVRDAEGNFIYAPNATVGGTKDGKRKVNHLGNAGQNRTIRIRPHKNGEFSWGVQTINAAYDGSAFAEGPAFSTTGISQTTVKENQSAKHYNAIGQQVKGNTHGIVITKHADGTVTKHIK